MTPEQEAELIEKMARVLAETEGSAMLFHRDGEMHTLASYKGFGKWGHSATDFAEKYWGDITLTEHAKLDSFTLIEAQENCEYGGWKWQNARI